MSLRTPAPVKPETPDKAGGGVPPLEGGGNGHSGNGHITGWPGEAPGPGNSRKRTSVWPFLLDLGLVMALFGLIITGRFLIVIGAVIFVVALIGWLREARADYSSLKE